MTRELSPQLQPLTYPGRAPAFSVLYDGEAEWPIDVVTGAPIGLAQDAGAALDRVLADHGLAPIAGRRPVLAVGSNASTAQLRAKFEAAGVSVIVPITRCTVTGLRVGVVPYISRYGYLPSAPIFDEDAESTLHVVWLDNAQLRAVDATEGPSYRRELIGDRASVTVNGHDEALEDVHVYASTIGLLALDGRPAPLTDQTTLIGQVLDAAHAGGHLLNVGDADEWVAYFTVDAPRRAGFVDICQQLSLIDLGAGV